MPWQIAKPNNILRLRDKFSEPELFTLLELTLTDFSDIPIR